MQTEGMARAEPVAKWAGREEVTQGPQGWRRKWEATLRGPRLVYTSVCTSREGMALPHRVSPGGLHADVTAVLTRGRGPISGSH